MLQDQLKKAIARALKVDDLQLEHPNIDSHGDYSTNIALQSKNPRELAEFFVKKIKANKELKNYISKFKVAGPGFINFYLKPEVLINELNQILRQKDQYGSSQSGKGKTMVIDYSAPNIAKRFTIGHLRSTIIGQAIYNFYQFLGWKCIGDNHLGDWGTQFGKMIVAINKWAKKSVDQLTVEEMETLYVRFHQEAEKDPRLDDQARQAFKNLEDGQKQERDLWQKLVKRSMAEFQQIYDLLNVQIDKAYGESFYKDLWSEVIKEAKAKKVAVKSQGALVISYPDDQLPPAILLKSDGATTYFTRDLATIKFRQKKWQPNLMVYEVGAEQTLHFRQVFLAAELLGWGKKDDFVHIPHGLIRLKRGKMSTRKGNVIKLNQVLQKAINRAKKFNPDTKISQAVGIGAIKYNDLKRHPKTGYTFNWQEALNLEGNSGPYLQYTHARCQSVLSKSKRSFSCEVAGDLNPEELSLLRYFYRFPEIVQSAAQQYAPNLICNFLFELSQRYNTFYNQHSILAPRIPNPESRIQLRLALTAATAQVLRNGLALLGIKAPNKM
jgi:arginyl-tRNA synthetase